MRARACVRVSCAHALVRVRAFAYACALERALVAHDVHMLMSAHESSWVLNGRCLVQANAR
eukprot:1421054-Pleurochrysis_carterae.AAC.1